MCVDGGAVGVEGQFEVVPSTLSAGWLQALLRRMLGAELPDRPTETFSWRTFRSRGPTMALCVSEPTRLPLHISRGQGTERSGWEPADQFNISGASNREAAEQAAFLPAAIIWSYFWTELVVVRYLMRPCKHFGVEEKE